MKIDVSNILRVLLPDILTRDDSSSGTRKKHPVVWHLLMTGLILFVATLVAFAFFSLGNNNSANITLIYILALFLIVMNTDGYIYGVAASVFCVVAVNYFFTYPFFKINFTLDGYPVTFLGMLAISLMASMTATRIKNQNAAIAEREKALVEADKEKLRANLLRAVSHDLRTPLTSIIGSSSSFLENYPDFTDAERLELIENIKNDSEWLLHMVENLLSVTRIQDGTQPVHKDPEVVEEVISEAIVRLQKRLPDIQVRVSMPNDFLMIPMDGTLIEQVLINLLENAFIHSKSKEPVDLNVFQTPELVTFVVRDYGIGLDPEKLPYIFEGQSTGSSTDGYKGMGIGLSICKTIITAHGGTIRAANHTHGAEFSFSLPTEDAGA